MSAINDRRLGRIASLTVTGSTEAKRAIALQLASLKQIDRWLLVQHDHIILPTSLMRLDQTMQLVSDAQSIVKSDTY